MDEAHLEQEHRKANERFGSVVAVATARWISNAQKDEAPDHKVGGFQEKSGGVLLSHMVSHAVPLALASLTSEFGMGSGVTSPL